MHAAVDVSAAAAERAPVDGGERQLKKEEQPGEPQTRGVCWRFGAVNDLLQLVALQRVGAEGAGTRRAQVALHVNQVGSFPLQGDHVKALPHQVVSRYEGGRLTLTGVPSQAGQDGSEAEEEEEESGGCDGEHG